MFPDTMMSIRVVYLEYLKKLYATFSVPQLLVEYGIDDKKLIPPVINPKYWFNLKMMKNENFTPLCYYDNTDYDSRNPDEWVKRNFQNGIQIPVPALVYLPVHDDNPQDYNWIDAYIKSYDYESKTYLVVIPDSDKVYPKVPRIQIHFKGEDPRMFVKRIKYAVIQRDYCEKMML